MNLDVNGADKSMSASEWFTHVGKVGFTVEPEIRQLASIVHEGDVVLDVGANDGNYAYTLARLVGETGQVICIEPLPRLVRHLREAASVLNLPIQVVDCAVSDRDGMADLHIPLEGSHQLHAQASMIPHGSDKFTTIEVQVRRLDDIMTDRQGRISFIKVDVEGHELSALRGAVATIEHHRPVLLVEIEKRHSPEPIERTFEFITGLGYQGSFLDGQFVWQPLSSFSPDLHQVPRDSHRRYVNNFFFRPES